jgi:AcrR family transcriptional regulator
MGNRLRADAQRNRDRLLEVAVRAFSVEGPDVTLESIAKDAGVGIGTLYRHFPTREALVEAAYRNELVRLCAASDELLSTLPPDKAMRAWMDHFVSYMTTKRGMSEALRALIASGGNPYAHSRDMLVASITKLLTALHAEVDPADVLVSLSGTTLAASSPEQASRLLDLLMDGLRVNSGS